MGCSLLGLACQNCCMHKGFGIATVSQTDGLSMIPTYAPGERLLIRYGAGFEVGDVVVLRHMDRIEIKRVKSLNADGVWVEGDNDPVSTDSRSYGSVPTQAIIGKVVYRFPRFLRSR